MLIFIAEIAQSSRQILGMFLKEKYSHKCRNLLLKFAESLRLVLGAFSKAMNSNKCWYLLLGMFAACVSTRFMVVVWEWDKYCWFLSWDSYIVNCAWEISVVEREISEFSLHNKISSLSLVFPKVWGFFQGQIWPKYCVLNVFYSLLIFSYFSAAKFT